MCCTQPLLATEIRHRVDTEDLEQNLLGPCDVLCAIWGQLKVGLPSLHIGALLL